MSTDICCVFVIYERNICKQCLDPSLRHALHQMCYFISTFLWQLRPPFDGRFNEREVSMSLSISFLKWGYIDYKRPTEIRKQHQNSQSHKEQKWDPWSRTADDISKQELTPSQDHQRTAARGLFLTIPRPHSVPSAGGMCWVRQLLCSPAALVHHSLLHCICWINTKRNKRWASKCYVIHYIALH